MNIPSDKNDEKEGTLEFRITKGNLMDTSLENVLFFDIQVGESRFALHRDKNFNLVFTHWSTKTGIRVAKVNIREFNTDKGLFIALTWSGKENYLYVGEEGGLNLKSSKAEQKGGEIRMGKNGALYQIGEESIEVGWYRVREAGRDVLEPTAKEIWDFTVTNSSSHRSFFPFYVATTPDSRVAPVNSIFILLGFSQPIFPSAPSKAFLTENTHFGGCSRNK